MDRPPLVGLRHAALRVRDVTAAARFYVDVLGFRVEWEPDADNVYLTSGADNLALHRAAVAPRGFEMGSDSALDHIGLAVEHAEDVDAWAAYLRGRGITLEHEPRTHRDGSRSLYLRDPADNLVQIVWHLPLLGV